MENISTIKKKLYLETLLNKSCLLLKGYKYNENKNAYFNNKGEEYNISENNWNDYDYFEIEEVLYENDYIDGILFFGDNTIEFHFKESELAENWNNFDIDTILKVIKNLEEKLSLA